MTGIGFGEVMQAASVFIAAILALNTFFSGRTKSGEERAEQRAETRLIRDKLDEISRKTDEINKKIDSHSERLLGLEHRLSTLTVRVDKLEKKEER